MVSGIPGTPSRRTDRGTRPRGALLASHSTSHVIILPLPRGKDCRPPDVATASAVLGRTLAASMPLALAPRNLSRMRDAVAFLRGRRQAVTGHVTVCRGMMGPSKFLAAKICHSMAGTVNFAAVHLDPQGARALGTSGARWYGHCWVERVDGGCSNEAGTRAAVSKMPETAEQAGRKMQSNRDPGKGPV